MRAAKSQAEIACIREAGRVTATGFAAAMKGMRAGMNEFDLQEAVEHAYRTNGARELAFRTIAGGGFNATVLHYHANDQVLQDGELVVLDSGAKHAGYSADVTRTLPVSGKFTPRQRELYDIVLRAQAAAIAAIKPGVTLAQVDAETGQHVVDLILDKAGQKGTGRWTLINAAENAVPVGTIHAAVDARILSAMKTLRVQASGLLHGPAGVLHLPDDAARAALVDKIHDALYASKIISYAQGLDLMRTMSVKKDWGLDLGAIAAIWRGGCIIRARFLNRITEAYQADPALAHLALAPFFQQVLQRAQAAWREVVGLAVAAGVPVPAFSASLAYYDSLRCARLPANLLQAQRDFFGAHTYERVDRPAGQFFHTQWPEVIG
jgi:6-phosphogluconate dehydrogenase (decarboxylating)